MLAPVNTRRLPFARTTGSWSVELRLPSSGPASPRVPPSRTGVDAWRSLVACWVALFSLAVPGNAQVDSLPRVMRVELVATILVHPGRIGRADLGAFAPETYQASLDREITLGGRLDYLLGGPWRVWLSGAFAPGTTATMADQGGGPATVSVDGSSYILGSGLSRTVLERPQIATELYLGAGLSVYRLSLPPTVACDAAGPGDGLCFSQSFAVDQTQPALEAGLRVSSATRLPRMSIHLGIRFSRYESELGGRHARRDLFAALGLRLN